MKKFEATLVDSDIKIVSDDLHFETKSSVFVLHSNIPEESTDYICLHLLCNETRKNLIQIRKILEKHKDDLKV